jgi:hypothetical protein
MRRVAVFGNAGAGKSTLAERLSELTGLSLHPIDLIRFPTGYRPKEKDGGKLSDEEYFKVHAELIKQDQWIIDGLVSPRHGSGSPRPIRSCTSTCRFLHITDGSQSVLCRAYLRILQDGRRMPLCGVARWTATGWFGAVIVA